MTTSTLAHPSAQTLDTPTSELLDFVQLLLRDYHPRDFTARMWDGAEWAAETDSPGFTLVLRHPDALRRMLRQEASGRALCEAFINGEIDVEAGLYFASATAIDLL